MPVFWFADSYTTHRLVAVEAETQEGAWEALGQGWAEWKYQEVAEGDYGPWQPTTAGDFHEDIGCGDVEKDELKEPHD